MDENFEKALRNFSVFPARHGQAEVIYESFNRDVQLFHDYMTAWKQGVRPEYFHSDYFPEKVALLPHEWQIPAQYVYEFITGTDDAIRINMDMQLARHKVTTGFCAHVPALWMSKVLNGINYNREAAQTDSVVNAVDWYRAGVRNTEVATILVAWQQEPYLTPPFAELDADDFLSMWKTWVVAEEPASHHPETVYRLIAAGVPSEYASAFPRTTHPSRIIDFWRADMPLEYATTIGE